MSAANLVKRRIFKWTAPGYEESFDQYTILSDGSVWITQIAFRDNSALVMQSGIPTRRSCATVEEAERWVSVLIESRSGQGVEILTPLDPRKCPKCEHMKFEHGPEVPGCVAHHKGARCTCKLNWEGENS